MAFSFEASQAKKATIDGFKEQILTGLATLRSGDNPPPTSDSLREEMDKLINPPADASGKTPSYVELGGKMVPTAKTMEEFGDATARSVDSGTQTMGMGWLGKIVTAIQAFFDWISGGSNSFTEAYAKITTNNISSAFDKEMEGMKANPEHKQFIEQNDLATLGKEKIADAVAVQAGLKQAVPAFDLDAVIKNSVPGQAEIKVESGGSPEEKVGGYLTQALENTKAPLKAQLDGLDEAQKDKLAQFEQALIKNGKELALGKGAPADANAYSEQLIKKTCEECGVDLGAGAEGKTLPQIIEGLRNGTPEQQQYAFLLSNADANLKQVHPFIAAAAKNQTLDETAVAKINEENKKASAASADDTITSAQDMIETKTRKAVQSALPAGIANTLAEKSSTWTGWAYSYAAGYGGNIRQSIEDVSDYNTAHPKGDGTPVAKQQKELFEFAAWKGWGPNQSQVDEIADGVGKAVKDSVTETTGKNLSSEQLAALVKLQIKQELQSRQAKINGMGNPVETINKEAGMDLFDKVASEVADNISQNKPGRDGKGTYDLIAGAQQMIHTANQEKAKANAEEAVAGAKEAGTGGGKDVETAQAPVTAGRAQAKTATKGS